MSDTEQQFRDRHWPALGREVKARTLNPLYHPSFVIFFFVAIIGLGPTGFWIELFNYMTDPKYDFGKVRASIVSFVPAFIAATTMQLIWAEGTRALRALAILMLSVCMLCLVLCGSEKVGNTVAMWLGCLSAIVSLWMWWIANANQKEFQDQTPDPGLNPVGGNLDRDLAGTLDGWRTE